MRTGIASLKVKFNSIFGYYIEISKANLHLVPAGLRPQADAGGAERFTTPELKEYEAKILDAQEKIVEIERRLFATLRTAIAGEAKRIRQTALALAEVDVLACSGARCRVAKLLPAAVRAGWHGESRRVWRSGNYRGPASGDRAAGVGRRAATGLCPTIFTSTPTRTRLCC